MIKKETRVVTIFLIMSYYLLLFLTARSTAIGFCLVLLFGCTFMFKYVSKWICDIPNLNPSGSILDCTLCFLFADLDRLKRREVGE